MANRRSLPRRQITRRKTAWLSFENTGRAVAANAAVLDGLLNAEALDQLPFTVVRARGLITVFSDQTAGVEDFGGVYAFAHTTQRATAAGIGAVDNPLGDATSSNFFVYQPISGRFLRDAVNGGISEAKIAFEFDSKSMRKLGIGDDIALVVEAFPTFGFTVGIVGRMLIKLH